VLKRNPKWGSVSEYRNDRFPVSKDSLTVLLSACRVRRTWLDFYPWSVGFMDSACAHGFTAGNANTGPHME